MLLQFQSGVTVCLGFPRFYPYSLKPQNRYKPRTCPFIQHTHCIYWYGKKKLKGFYLYLQITTWLYKCTKVGRGPSENKHSSAFPPWLQFAKFINATLQAPGLKLQLTLLRISCGEVSSAAALCHIGFICMVLCKGSM